MTTTTAPTLSVERQMECQPRLVQTASGQYVWEYCQDADWIAYQDYLSERRAYSASMSIGTSPATPRANARLDSRVAFSEWLADTLANAGMEWADLDRAMGARPGTHTAWRNGHNRPQIATCHRIAAALNISPDLVLMKAGKVASNAPAKKHEAA